VSGALRDRWTDRAGQAGGSSGEDDRGGALPSPEEKAGGEEAAALPQAKDAPGLPWVSVVPWEQLGSPEDAVGLAAAGEGSGARGNSLWADRAE